LDVLVTGAHSNQLLFFATSANYRHFGVQQAHNCCDSRNKGRFAGLMLTNTSAANRELAIQRPKDMFYLVRYT
jgi:hypothetical protein